MYDTLSMVMYVRRQRVSVSSSDVCRPSINMFSRFCCRICVMLLILYRRDTPPMST